MKIKQVDRETKGHFKIEENGIEAGIMTYTWVGRNVFTIDHTEVKPEYKGRKFGNQLVMAAVDFAREKNVKISPICPFVKSIFEKTTEINDVLLMKRKIIAFAGSNSSKSINKNLVVYTLKAFAEYSVEFLDLNDFEMPIYSFDREQKDGVPEKALAFRKHMADSDAIICSLAEHNGNFSAALKNILDWCSRVDANIFAGKPMLLMTTSSGRFGGGGVMDIAKKSFKIFGASIAETFSLPYFNKSFIDNRIVDVALEAEHSQKIESFKKILQ